MARFDEWGDLILKAQKEWEEIPYEIGKVSLSVHIYGILMSIDDARRFLQSVGRNQRTDKQKRDSQLRAIRQYLSRDLPARQETQRLAADLKKAKKLAREKRYQEKLAARLPAGMSLEQLNANRVAAPVKTHSKAVVKFPTPVSRTESQNLVGDVEAGTDPIEQMKAAMGGYYKKD